MVWIYISNQRWLSYESLKYLIDLYINIEHLKNLYI